MFLLVLEIFSLNILLRRVSRLRALIQNSHLRSQFEIDQASLKFFTVLISALIKSIEIILKYLVIAFVNIYISLIYDIYYFFFEVFSLVYSLMYDFFLSEIDILFFCILVFCLLEIAVYVFYIHFHLISNIFNARTSRAEDSSAIRAYSDL